MDDLIELVSTTKLEAESKGWTDLYLDFQYVHSEHKEVIYSVFGMREETTKERKSREREEKEEGKGQV